MKKIGIIVLIIGLVGLVLALGIDTSVATGHGDNRVHNIGLMSEKQNYLFVAIALAVVGVVLLALGIKNGTPLSFWNPTDANKQSRACPYCAEQIKSKAVVCRFCGKDVEPSIEGVAEEIDGTTFESMGWKKNNLKRVVASIRAHKRRYLVGCIRAVPALRMRKNWYIVGALLSLVIMASSWFAYGTYIDYRFTKICTELRERPETATSVHVLCEYEDKYVSTNEKSIFIDIWRVRYSTEN